MASYCLFTSLSSSDHSLSLSSSLFACMRLSQVYCSWSLGATLDRYQAWGRVFVPLHYVPTFFLYRSSRRDVGPAHLDPTLLVQSSLLHSLLPPLLCMLLPRICLCCCVPTQMGILFDRNTLLSLRWQSSEIDRHPANHNVQNGWVISTRSRK